MEIKVPLCTEYKKQPSSIMKSMAGHLKMKTDSTNLILLGG